MVWRSPTSGASGSPYIERGSLPQRVSHPER